MAAGEFGAPFPVQAKGEAPSKRYAEGDNPCMRPLALPGSLVGYGWAGDDHWARVRASGQRRSGRDRGARRVGPCDLQRHERPGADPSRRAGDGRPARRRDRHLLPDGRRYERRDWPAARSIASGGGGRRGGAFSTSCRSAGGCGSVQLVSGARRARGHRSRPSWRWPTSPRSSATKSERPTWPRSSITPGTRSWSLTTSSC